MSDTIRPDRDRTTAAPGAGPADEATAEPDALASARAEATELGARPLGRPETELVRQIARMLSARGVVCLGPAPGVAALAALAADVPGSVVTCIDVDPHRVEAAKSSLRAAGVPSTAGRFIAARPVEVLDKLADGGYDLVVAEPDADSADRIVQRCTSLLRPGGALVLTGPGRGVGESVELPTGAYVTELEIGDGLVLVTV